MIIINSYNVMKGQTWTWWFMYGRW